jgi:hypothetical protein
VKDHHQNAGHEIHQIGACGWVHRNDFAFVSDHQVQKLQLQHDDLLRIRQQPFAEGYREPGLSDRVAELPTT